MLLLFLLVLVDLFSAIRNLYYVLNKEWLVASIFFFFSDVLLVEFLDLHESEMKRKVRE